MLSVIIPIYNAERYLRRCVESVLDSAYPEFELILVDDGSTDGCPSICRDFAEQDCRVRVFRQEHQGASAARNRGIRESRGEWLVFVDADDRISRDLLSLIVREEHRALDLLFFDFAEREEELSPSGHTGKVWLYEGEEVAQLTERTLVPRPLPEGGAVNFISCCGRAYRKSILEQADIVFSQELFYGEDRIFNLEFLLQARRCAHISAPVYFYAYHGDSASHSYSPALFENHTALVEKMKTLLTDQGRYAALEWEYASCVLDHLVSLLVYVVFIPGRETSERRAFLRQIWATALFQEALGHSWESGSLQRRMFLCAFRWRLYFLVDWICWCVHRWRGYSAG